MKYQELLESYLAEGYSIEEALAMVDKELYNELYEHSLAND